MDYIASLEKEDIAFVCKTIPGKALKQLYQKNSKEFARIKPGFRPQALTEEEAISLAIHNADKAFIRFFLNLHIEILLKEIDGHVDDFIKQGENRGKALVESLSNSSFSKNVPLYLRLANDLAPDECALILQSAVDFAQNSNDKKAKVMRGKPRNKQRHSGIRDRQEILTKLEEQKAACEAAEKSLADVQKELLMWQDRAEKCQREVDSWNALASQQISTERIVKHEGFPYTSLCMVTLDYDGRPWLNRLFDVNDELVLGDFAEDSPRRTRLYSKSGPSDEGYVGIWDWKVEPNASDPTKDYVTSIFNESYPVIEMVVLEGCSAVEDVIGKVTKGVNSSANSNRIWFGFQSRARGGYEGILCNKKDVQFRNQTISLAPHITKLPVFAISASDVIAEKDRLFCSRFDIGTPLRMATIKDVLLIVKDIILKRITWPVLKQKGMTRNDFRQIRDFLEDLKTESLFCEVARACECNEDEAQQLVEQFILVANSYLEGKDVESESMARIAQQNQELLEICKAEIAAEWEEENSKKIAAARAELQNIAAETAQKEESLQKVQADVAQAAKELKRFRDDMKAQETLAQNVEQKVAERIQQAQQDAADFLAQQILYNAQSSKPPVTLGESSCARWVEGVTLPPDGLEINHSWQESIDTISVELGEAGVAAQYTQILSAVLYAAFITRTPLLLAGPFAHDIADAFSCALFGKTAGVLTCEGSPDDAVVDLAINNSDKVIIVENPYATGWFQAFARLSDKFLLAVCPYAEDLQIEPRGFVNYFIPIVTEILVDSRPERKFVGGTICDDYEDYKSDVKPKRDSAIASLRLSPYAEKVLNNLRVTIDGMLTPEDVGLSCTLLLVSCLYTCGKAEKIRDIVESIHIPDETKQLFLKYYGDEP